ncbi:MAG: InlB B-repeat-containing protein [Anaerovoracaceae bacterium]
MNYSVKASGKIIVLILFFISFFLPEKTQAAYLENIKTQVKQPNGVVLNLFASGDEFFNYLHDKDGNIIKQASNGYYVYTKQNKGSIVENKNYVVGKVQLDVIKDNIVNESDSVIAKEASRVLSQGNELEEVTKTTQKASMATFGQMANLIIYIRFADEKEFVSTSFMNKVKGYFVNDKQSVGSYIKAESRGETEAKTVIPVSYSYKDIYNRNYFQPYNETTNPNGYVGNVEREKREHSLLLRAVESIAPKVSSSQVLDYNNDNRIDNVNFIVSGMTNGWNNLLWPHKWDLFSVNAKINGKRVYTFNFNLAGSGYFSLDTLIHEFKHTIGFPDLYRYYDDSRDYKDKNPVAEWDMMADSRDQYSLFACMADYTSWAGKDDTRYYIKSNGDATTYSLYPTTNASSSKSAVKVISNVNPKEYFVIEYRRNDYTRTIWDKGLNDSGLIVYRVNVNNAGDGNRDGKGTDLSLDQYYVFRTGASPDSACIDGVKRKSYGSLNLSNTNKNSTIYYSNGQNSGIVISIVETSGEKITFTVTRKEGATMQGITYVVNGGKLPIGARTSYMQGETFDLSIPTKLGTSFLGWYTEEDYKNRITRIKADDIKPKTFYAKWGLPESSHPYSYGTDESIYYKHNLAVPALALSFDTKTELGSIYDRVFIYKGDGATMIEDCPSEGFTGKEFASKKLLVSGDEFYIRLRAESSTRKFGYKIEKIEKAARINYVLGGGTNPLTARNYYAPGENLLLQEAKKLGTCFLGWYTASTGGIKVTEIKASDTGDKTFYARWGLPESSHDQTGKYELEQKYYHIDKVSKLAIVFDPMTKEEEETDIITIYDGKGVEVAGSPFTGSTLAGKRLIVDGSEFTIRIKKESATKQYGYKATSVSGLYCITYNLGGGVFQNAVKREYFEKEVFSLPYPIKLSSCFLGWYTAAMGGTRVTGITALDKGNKNYFARWGVYESPHSTTSTLNFKQSYTSPKQAIRVILTFDSKTAIDKTKDKVYIYRSDGKTGISGSPFSGTLLSGKTKTVYGNGFVINWVKTSKVKQYGYRISSIQADYRISYILNGGVNTSLAKVEYRSGKGYVLPIPKKAKSTFLGWYTANIGGVRVKEISGKDSGAKVYYARWKPVT